MNRVEFWQSVRNQDEIADAMSYCILSERYSFDVKKIIKDKIAKNEKKYPKDKAYGKSDKYTDFKNLLIST